MSPDSVPDSGRGRRPFGLAPRTLALCLTVAVVGALVAALIATVVLRNDSKSTAGGHDLTIDKGPVPAKLLSAPLLDFNSKATTLGAQLDGRTVLVNIWAQSCAPCVKEMPLLEASNRKHPDIQFIGVDTQDHFDAARKMVEKTGISYPWVQDPTGEFFYEARGAGMPTTLLLTAKGHVLASKTGAFASGDELETWIQNYRD